MRRTNLNSIKVVRSYHSADCDTDHLLVCCKIKMTPKRMFFSKVKGKPRLNTANMQDPELVAQFTNLFEEKYSPLESDSAERRWEVLKTAMHSCALATFGKKKQPSLLTGLRQSQRNSIQQLTKRGICSVLTIRTPALKTCASLGKPEMKPNEGFGNVQMTTG